MRKHEDNGNPGPAAPAKFSSLNELQQISQQLMETVKAKKKGRYYGMQLHDGWNYPAEMMFLYEAIFPERVINVNTNETAQAVEINFKPVLIASNDEWVTLIDGKPATTSRMVAQVFGKNHKDVLRAISRLDNYNGFTERNLAPSTYKDPTGRTLKEAILTRDGFTYLVMGFIGKEAAKFKIEYIDQFNRMEEALRGNVVPVKSEADLLREENLMLHFRLKVMQSEHKTELLEQAYELIYKKPVCGDTFKYLGSA